MFYSFWHEKMLNHNRFPLLVRIVFFIRLQLWRWVLVLRYDKCTTSKAIRSYPTQEFPFVLVTKAKQKRPFWLAIYDSKTKTILSGISTKFQSARTCFTPKIFYWYLAFWDLHVRVYRKIPQDYYIFYLFDRSMYIPVIIYRCPTGGIVQVYHVSVCFYLLLLLLSLFYSLWVFNTSASW